MRRYIRFILVLFLFTIFYLLFSISFAQTPTPTSRVDLLNAFGTGDFDHDGRADDLTVSGSVSANPVKTSLSQTASAGQKSIFIGGASGFAQKDEVAIIQMSGTNAGVWETAYVLDTRPKGRLLLHRTLTNTYTVDASSKAQVVKVPHYRNVRVQNGGTLTVDPWNGASGGVMFLRAQNDFDVRNGGKVDVSGLGFRGGVGTSGVSMQCGDYMYCSTGTSCWPYTEGTSVIYECRADSFSTTTRTSSEGPSGSGGAIGSRGNNGWHGGTRGRSNSSGSRQYYTSDGGGGGGAGGGGAGGSLAVQGSTGQAGGSGAKGGEVFSTCSGPGSGQEKIYSPTGEKYLHWQWNDFWHTNTYTCDEFKNVAETLYYSSSSTRNSEATWYNGPPGRGGNGGGGGSGNSSASLSGSKALLGSGGGAGASGGIGGNGGSGTIGGIPGAGASGGAGGGAVIIFAKSINVQGQVISNGQGGINGTDGGNGAEGFSRGCSGDCSAGGGGGGGAGGGGGGGSGGTLMFFGESVSLGTNQATALGGSGGVGGVGGAGNKGGYGGGGQSGAGGGGGGRDSRQICWYESSGDEAAYQVCTPKGTTGSARGGNGSTGAVVVIYKNSFSGSSSTNIQASKVANITKQ